MGDLAGTNLKCLLLDTSVPNHQIFFTYFTGVAAKVVGAGCSVLARIGNAFIHLLLTVAARVSGLTVTIVCVSSIQTLARVTTQPGHLYA